MEKSFERDVLDRLTKIETKLDDYNSIKTKVEQSNLISTTNKKDIEEIQDKIRWISRSIVGAIIAGLIGLFFAVLKR